MEKTPQEEINLEPLKTFFADEVSPAELAQVLDNIVFDYIEVLVKLGDCIPEETLQQFFYLRMLRNIFQTCEK